MHTYLDCYPCFLRQALGAARHAGATEPQQHAILLRTMDALHELPAEATPPLMAARIHALVRELLQDPDPYRKAKQQATRQALALYPKLQRYVAQAEDPLDTAVRIAIAGNIIDLGAAEDYDLGATLERVLQQPYAVADLPALRHGLKRAERVLYLADNSGETVFDRVLIEALGLPVTYVVKGGPVINDATREDAVAAGIDRVAEVVDNGSDAPGTLLEQCSAEFRRRFEQAQLIIAKGQGNYESLSGVSAPAPVFFLLQTKCAVIARDLGVREGSIVLKAHNS